MRLKRNGILGQFACAPLALSGNWQPLIVISDGGLAPNNNNSRFSTFGSIDKLGLSLSVVGGSVSAFKVQWSFTNGGDMDDLLVTNADYTNGNKFCDFASPNFPVVATRSKLFLANLFSVAEVQFLAQGTGTLYLTGGGGAIATSNYRD